jgi:isopropylmalate/homocitrate/citramalate synthase
MVRLRDVTLRDGLQDEAPISTEAKVRLWELLVTAGVRDLELTSFTRPDRVPAMADAERLTEIVLAARSQPARGRTRARVWPRPSAVCHVGL